jgi:hypothetical protein
MIGGITAPLKIKKAAHTSSFFNQNIIGKLI